MDTALLENNSRANAAAEMGEQYSLTRILLLAIGLIWLFVLSMVIVRQQEGDLRW